MRAIFGSILLLLSATASTLADGVYKDRERFDERAVTTTKKTGECSRSPFA